MDNVIKLRLDDISSHIETLHMLNYKLSVELPGMPIDYVEIENILIKMNNTLQPLKNKIEQLLPQSYSLPDRNYIYNNYTISYSNIKYFIGGAIALMGISLLMG